MSKPQNPQAFPNGLESHDKYNNRQEVHEGMTLRDYFAAKEDSYPHYEFIIKKGKEYGVKYEIAVEKLSETHFTPEQWCEVVAEWKYLNADAMLKQREL